MRGIGEFALFGMGLVKGWVQRESPSVVALALSVLIGVLLLVALLKSAGTGQELNFLAAAQSLLAVLAITDVSTVDSFVSWMTREELVWPLRFMCLLSAAAVAMWDRFGIPVAWVILLVCSLNLGSQNAFLLALGAHVVIHGWFGMLAFFQIEPLHDSGRKRLSARWWVFPHGVDLLARFACFPFLALQWMGTRLDDQFTIPISPIAPPPLGARSVDEYWQQQGQLPQDIRPATKSEGEGTIHP